MTKYESRCYGCGETTQACSCFKAITLPDNTPEQHRAWLGRMAARLDPAQLRVRVLRASEAQDQHSETEAEEFCRHPDGTAYLIRYPKSL